MSQKTFLSTKLITLGFIIAGLVNVAGPPTFTRFFTSDVIPETDPVVMSDFGLVMIMVWGLAYLSVSKSFHQVKWLVGVFAIEKLIYGIIWTKWMMSHSVSDVFDQDVMAGIFYSIYGLNDWLFFLFFGLVFIQLISKK